MVIRSVTLIDGTGGPPLSPMDIVIEGNRITSVRQAGWPGLPQQPNREPRDADFEIDGKGMYVMPGFVDMHVHGAGKDKAPDLSYSYKLWLAHGVTTVRGVSLSSAAVSSSEKDRSAKNEIAAPRIFNYQTLGSGWPNGPVHDAGEGARVGALGRRQQHRRHQVLQPRRRDAGDHHARRSTKRTRTRWARSPTCRRTASPTSTPAMPATRTSTPSPTTTATWNRS